MIHNELTFINTVPGLWLISHLKLAELHCTVLTPFVLLI